MPFDYSQLSERAAASLTRWANHLSLWRLCDKAACRRMRACRGQVRVCFPDKFELLPDLVRDWFVFLMDARRHDLPFDDAMKMLKGTDVEEAFLEWHEAAAKSSRHGAARR